MASSINQSNFSSVGTPSVTVANAGDLLLLISKCSSGGGTPFISAITDSQGNTWNQSVLGAFGASSSYFTINTANYFLSAFYAYALASGTCSISSATYNGGTPGTHQLW